MKRKIIKTVEINETVETKDDAEVHIRVVESDSDKLAYSLNIEYDGVYVSELSICDIPKEDLLKIKDAINGVIDESQKE